MESSFGSMKNINFIKSKTKKYFYNLKHTTTSRQSNLENVGSKRNSRPASEKMDSFKGFLDTERRQPNRWACPPSLHLPSEPTWPWHVKGPATTLWGSLYFSIFHSPCQACFWKQLPCRQVMQEQSGPGSMLDCLAWPPEIPQSKNTKFSLYFY